ncbi:MAG: DUF402 domain-containing protein [Traorella sp.]
MEKKYLSRSEWKRILKRKYVHQYINDSTFQGEIALHLLEKVTSPRSSNLNGEVTWIDNGYYWLQFAFEKMNIWLTVMLNEKGIIQQYYFDITDRNVIDEHNDSYFYDLYLDVVVSNSKIFVLDEDELEEAYKNHEIDLVQYQKAIDIKDQLVRWLENHLDELEKSCMKYFYMLKEQL